MGTEIILTSDHDSLYYQDQLNSLGNSLKKYKFKVFVKPGLSKTEKNCLINSGKYKAIIDINGSRNNVTKNTKIIYLSWIQDVFSEEQYKNLRYIKDCDYILCLGDEKNLGLNLKNINKNHIKYFYSGASKKVSGKKEKKIYDINLIGFIPNYFIYQNKAKIFLYFFIKSKKFFFKKGNIFLRILRLPLTIFNIINRIININIEKKIIFKINQSYKAFSGKLSINEIKQKIKLVL